VHVENLLLIVISEYYLYSYMGLEIKIDEATVFVIKLCQ
jgi:hypothetical protein